MECGAFSLQWQELPDYFQTVLGGLLFGNRSLFRSYPVVRGMSHMANSTYFLVANRNLINFSPWPLPSLVNIVFRKWRLPNPMTSPIVGTILFYNPRIEVYSGPLDHDVWRSVIFPAGNVAHCITLEVVARCLGPNIVHIGNCPPKVRIVSSVLSSFVSWLPNWGVSYGWHNPEPLFWCVDLHSVPHPAPSLSSSCFSSGLPCCSWSKHFAYLWSQALVCVLIFWRFAFPSRFAQQTYIPTCGSSSCIICFWEL